MQTSAGTVSLTEIQQKTKIKSEGTFGIFDLFIPKAEKNG